MKRAETFIFNKIIFEKNKIKFEYIIDNKKFFFYTKLYNNLNIDKDSKYLICANIGISYMIDLLIVTLPKIIDIRVIELKKGAIDFWKKIYFNGLLERLYDEKLSIELYDSVWLNNSEIYIEPIKSKSNKYLLAMSGGKESLSILNIFNNKKYKNFDLFFLKYKINKEGLGFYENKVFNKLKNIYFSIKLETNIEDLKYIMELYDCKDNSVLVIAQLIFNSLLYCDKYKGIIIGNEYSSNFGNSIYHGYEVNHQHDKTIDFANMVNEYIDKYIIKDYNYFSPYFGLYEYKIAEYFYKDNKFLNIWTSCNNTKKGKNFCCNCPKCAFTYAVILQYTNKNFLSLYFKENLLNNLSLFKEIMDFDIDKPLDCVGIKEEVWLSVYNIYRKGIDTDSIVIKYFLEKILPHIKNKISDIEIELNKEKTNGKYLPKEFKKIFTF